MQVENSFIADHIPAEFIETSWRLRRLIEERASQSMKLQETVDKLKHFAVSFTPEERKRVGFSDLEKELVSLRLEHHHLKAKFSELSAQIFDIRKENQDLLQLIKHKDSKYQLEKEQWELLESNLRNSIQSLSKQTKPGILVEEQNILINSLRDTISRLLLENADLRSKQSVHLTEDNKL